MGDAEPMKRNFTVEIGHTTRSLVFVVADSESEARELAASGKGVELESSFPQQPVLTVSEVTVHQLIRLSKKLKI